MNRVNHKKPAKQMGKRYASAAQLLADSDLSEEVREAYESIKQEHQVAEQLRQMRRRAGITVSEMAKFLRTTEEKVVEVETSSNRELTLGILQEYARHARTRIAVRVGPPLNHVESIKSSAFEIKRNLKALAALAKREEELNESIQSFFGEAFFNILKILGECQRDLPSEKEPRIQLLSQSSVKDEQEEFDARQLSFY